MPELPEVQTIVNDLNKKIKGDSIVSFWSDWAKTIKNISVKKFEKEIKNKKIIKAWRIGKNMFIDLSGGKTIYIHLKMTGHLLIKNRELKIESKKNYFNDKVNSYVHHSWKLEDRNKKIKTLEFSDLRKFGKIMLLNTREIPNLPEIKKLGIDAMDKKFNLQKFFEILEKKNVKNKKIGIILMEQELIAGIGNIYRSEILFEAGVNPEKIVAKLSVKEKEAIFKQIKKVLQKAIKFRGTSDSDYRDTSGAPGGFQNIMKTYRREKEKCVKCKKEKIRRIKIGQRSVFYCPKCQK